MDVQVHRKQRLRELIEHSCGNVIAAFAEKIARNESYVSRMLYPAEKAGAKPIADKMMRVIEQAFGLSRAWLDLPLGAELPDLKMRGEANSRVDTSTSHIVAAQHSVRELDNALVLTAEEHSTIFREASDLLLKMSSEGRKNSITYMRFMLTQHPADTQSGGGERDSIPHQKAA